MAEQVYVDSVLPVVLPGKGTVNDNYDAQQLFVHVRRCFNSNMPPAGIAYEDTPNGNHLKSVTAWLSVPVQESAGKDLERIRAGYLYAIANPRIYRDNLVVSSIETRPGFEHQGFASALLSCTNEFMGNRLFFDDDFTPEGLAFIAHKLPLLLGMRKPNEPTSPSMNFVSSWESPI